jgi:hypothetical protein
LNRRIEAIRHLVSARDSASLLIFSLAIADMAVLPDAAASASLHQRPGSPRRKPPR